jgi:hypothetical protein
MKRSITQEMPNGCGIACFAFVANLTYKQTEKFLGMIVLLRRSKEFPVGHYLAYHQGASASQPIARLYDYFQYTQLIASI